MDTLSLDGFEMAQSFGLKTKKKTAAELRMEPLSKINHP
jgi:hypothetical protein